MSGESKQKTAHYKLCKIESKELQSLLNAAIGPEGSANHPSKRIQKVGNDDDDSVIFINKFKKHQTICCGELVYIESGNYKHYIKYASELDESEAEYAIDTISSDDIPDKDPIGKEGFKKKFVDSVLYFGVFKNHLLVVQSKSLRARQLETYLNWLLKREDISAISIDEDIILSDSAPKKIYDRLVDSPVKAIRFGSPVSSAQSSADTNIKKSQVMKLGSNDAGRGARMLQSIFPGFGKGLDLESVTDSANLHLSLEITYKYSTTEDGQKIIDALASSMRNAYGSDVSCELEGGEIITGSDLKISQKINCKYTENGILITGGENGLFEKFFDWFKKDLIKIVEM